MLGAPKRGTALNHCSQARRRPWLGASLSSVPAMVRSAISSLLITSAPECMLTFGPTSTSAVHSVARFWSEKDGKMMEPCVAVTTASHRFCSPRRVAHPFAGGSACVCTRGLRADAEVPRPARRSAAEILTAWSPVHVCQGGALGVGAPGEEAEGSHGIVDKVEGHSHLLCECG